MVSGDVFRAPANPLSLCVQIGSGVQILCSGFITLLFAALGFLSPASRGSLLTAALVMYLLLSVAAGYAAVWLWGLVNRSYEGWFKVRAAQRQHASRGAAAAAAVGHRMVVERQRCRVGTSGSRHLWQAGRPAPGQPSPERCMLRPCPPPASRRCAGAWPASSLASLWPS